MSNRIHGSSEALRRVLRRTGLFAVSLCGALASGCTDAMPPGEEPGAAVSEGAAAMPDERVQLAERAPDRLAGSESATTEDEHAHDSLRLADELRAPRLASSLITYSCQQADLQFTVWPVSGAHGADWMIQNYTDQDPAATLEDYKGKVGSLARTYDGHRGADINIPTMREMDNNTAVVRAAAPGVVEFVREDQYDRNTSCTGTWNVVLLRHANGYASYYGHLKKSSVVVNVGDVVVAGQKLGIVGSSGCSTQAHLHFEVHDCDDNWVESFEPMWSAPPIYDGPADVMDVILRDGAFASVDQLKDPAPNPTLFQPGEAMGVGLSVAARGGDSFQLEMIAPDASVASSWSWTVSGAARYSQRFPSWTWTVGTKPGTWSLRVKINSIITHTHSFKVSNYLPGSTEIARHGVPAASYQDAVNDAVAAGYRPVWVDGFDVNGATYYNAIFRPAGGVSWVARHNLTSAQYQTEAETWTDAGLRITNVDAYISAGGIRYAAIFTGEPGASWTAYHGVSEATHVSNFNTLAAQGFRPVNVSVVSLGGVRHVTALWDKAAFGGWVGLHRIPSASYQAEVNTQLAAGRRPHYINAYTHDGGIYYSAVFSSSSLGASWVARHGLSAAAYQTEWTSQSDAGYLTKLVTGVDAGNTAAYAAIWVK